MKVTIKTLKEPCDSRECMEIEIDGDVVCYFCDGEPEDNSISRNFSDVFFIGDLLVEANQRGMTGETIIIERIKVDEL